MTSLLKLLVGVDVSKPDNEMFNFCLDICSKYNATLVLASFIAPIDVNILSDSYFPEAELDFVDKIIKEEEQKVKKYFEQLMTDYGGNVEIETIVSVNDPVIGLSETAKQIEATAIAVGFDSDENSFLLRSTSTGSRLVNNSDIPVLVIPMGYNKLFTEEDAILITDDLSDEGMNVVESAVDFVSLFDTERVVHCHIINNENHLKYLISRFIELMGLENNDEEEDCSTTETC